MKAERYTQPSLTEPGREIHMRNINRKYSISPNTNPESLAEQALQDFDDSDDDAINQNEPDPTLSPSFDRVDHHLAVMALQAKHKEAMRVAARQAATEKAAKQADLENMQRELQRLKAKEEAEKLPPAHNPDNR